MKKCLQEKMVNGGWLLQMFAETDGMFKGVGNAERPRTGDVF
jgi:hypothetical protein